MREKNNAEPVAVTGRQAELYASLGKRLAAATRAGSAPNQRITNCRRRSCWAARQAAG